MISTYIKFFFCVFSWFRRLSATLCCSSSCAALFDFASFVVRCLFASYWKINFRQSQIQSMIWASTLQIQKHGYSGDLDFIILFVGILPLNAINLGAVSLFADSPFTFLAILIMLLALMYFINMNEWISLFLSTKKKSMY